ncbi:MAG: hypothetical protein ACRD0Y_07830 [Terriglobales bacterium]
MASRQYDERTPVDRTTQTFREWSLILGLCLMLVVWALIAFAAIGSGTRLSPNYNLVNPTPAGQAYNTIHEFQRPRR